MALLQLQLVFVLLGIWSAGVVRAQDMNLKFVANADSRDAVCNDGSPGAYYIRNGTGAGTSLWVFHLEGGFWCWDESSCASRWKDSPSLMSSKNYGPTAYVSGLLSSEQDVNPDFYNANTVLIKYCSSDAWSGTNGSAYSWVFRGQKIIKAVLEDTILSLSTPPPRKLGILFSGCSAGGQGVLMNLPWVTDYLNSSHLGPYIGILKSMADAGWMMDITPLNHNPSSGQQFQAGVPMWGPGAVDPDCVAANVGNLWMCFVSPYLFPYLTYSKTPIFMQTNQYDAFQVPFDCCTPPWANDNDQEFAETVRSAFHTGLTDLIQPPSAVFSAACFDHCLTESNSLFTKVQVSGVSLRDALHGWFFEDRPTKLIETCAGVNCSPGCSPLP